MLCIVVMDKKINPLKYQQEWVYFIDIQFLFLNFIMKTLTAFHVV